MGTLGRGEHVDGNMGETPGSMDVSERCLLGHLETLGGLRLSIAGAVQWAGRHTQHLPGLSKHQNRYLKDLQGYFLAVLY